MSDEEDDENIPAPAFPAIPCYGGPLDGDFVAFEDIPREGRDGSYAKQRLVLHRMQRSTVEPARFLRVPIPSEVVWYWYPYSPAQEAP